MHPHHHGGHGGNIPRSAFWNWGWGEPSVEYYVIENPVPEWAYIAGGALAGMTLLLLMRD